jgi:2-dehydropantoate 2-reductase
MVFLATFAGLTALTRLPIGPIRDDTETRAMLRAGLAEAFAVAHAKRIALPDDFVERTLERCDRLPYEMKSSMLQDLERGRRLELPWLSGALVRLGQELGVPTPTHALITTALKLHTDGS